MKITTEYIADHGMSCHGQVIYDLSEEMIETRSTNRTGFASVLVNDLNLEFDESRRIFSIWGYLPKDSWNRGVVPHPVSARGVVRIDSPTTAGASLRVTKVGAFWPINYDQSTGWIYIGEYDLHGVGKSECVEIFESAILRVEAGSLVGLWMKPEIVHFS